MNSVLVNSGIGDLLLSRAILAGSKGVIKVSLGEEAVIENRDASYLPFARELFDALFVGHTPADPGSPRLDPQGLCRLTGLLPRWPWMHDLGGDKGGYFVVTTKVRGLPRRIYEHIRHDFVERIRRLTQWNRVVLVGEKIIGMNAEYRHHGEDLVYSIYGDLMALGCEDRTVDELGVTPPTMGQFLNDMAAMQGAASVITLGTGGNTSMAMASGNCYSFVGFSEMEEFFSRMPWRPRGCRMFDNVEAFLGGI